MSGHFTPYHAKLSKSRYKTCGMVKCVRRFKPFINMIPGNKVITQWYKVCQATHKKITCSQ